MSRVIGPGISASSFYLVQFRIALSNNPGFNFSQTAICNINNVVKSLRARLKARGKARRMDEHGNPIYKDCDVFTVDELVAFICQSLTMFNELPVFTMFTWDDTPITQRFHDILVQGSLYLALGAQSLIERGREFTINDNGIGSTPPQQAELLKASTQRKWMLGWQSTAIKKIWPPAPLGSERYHLLAEFSPQIRDLRHLRERSPGLLSI